MSKKKKSNEINLIISFILTPHLHPTSQSLLPLKPLVSTSPNKTSTHTFNYLTSHTSMLYKSQIGNFFLSDYSLITYLHIFVYEIGEMPIYSVSFHASI